MPLNKRDRERQAVEQAFARAIGKQLAATKREVLKEAQRDMPQFDELFWEKQAEALQAAIFPILLKAYIEGQTEFLSQIGKD